MTVFHWLNYSYNVQENHVCWVATGKGIRKAGHSKHKRCDSEQLHQLGRYGNKEKTEQSHRTTRHGRPSCPRIRIPFLSYMLLTLVPEAARREETKTSYFLIERMIGWRWITNIHLRMGMSSWCRNLWLWCTATIEELLEGLRRILMMTDWFLLNM